MGGFGSGRRRKVNRGTVESYRWIDIDALSRTQSLWNGWSGVVQWPAGDGRPAVEIHVRAEGDHVALCYRIGPEARDVQDTIAVQDIGCHFGLGRPYFVCPGLDLNRPCNRLVRRLYLVDQQFRCRHCHRLVYASRSETSADRAHRRANAIRTRLGGAVGIARPFPDKPPRLWRRTFERLRHKAATAEQQANQVLVDEFGLTATFPPVAGTAGAPPETDERGARVLEHLWRIAFSDIGDFFDDGGQVKPIANVSPEARSALKAYITRADGSVTGVRLHNRLRALKRLAKHLGLL